VWEWTITIFSPEADIRVDLLLSIPSVPIVSDFGTTSLFFKHTPAV